MTVLDRAAAPYTFHHHARAFTAQEVAAREHISGDRFAKVVMVVVDGELMMTVTRASDHVDVRRLRDAIGARDVRVAFEHEFVNAFPDCEAGAMPPFGNLYDVPVIVDRRLMQYDDIVAQAGSHTETISVHYEDFVRVVHPRVVDLTLHV